MEYLILRRRSRSAHRGPDSTNVAVGDASADVELIVQDLPPSESSTLGRDPDIIRSAESVPVELIAPVTEENEGSASTDLDVSPSAGCAWGIKTVGAEDCDFTGSGVCVAVLDTGIDTSHAAFEGLEVIGRNFTPKSAIDTAIDPDDIRDHNGHGTHCAGTFVGRDVGGQRIGVAPGVETLIVARVIGDGVAVTTGGLISAMNWAIDEGAQILSMSLSINFLRQQQRLEDLGVHGLEATSRAMKLLIDNVRFFDKYSDLLRTDNSFGRNAVVIAASGNQSDRFGKRFSGKPFVLNANYPGDSEDFLSVAAISPTDREAKKPYEVAEFSNSGADLAGPGVDVLSAAAGDDRNALRKESGTSMATPHVAGVATLWTQKLILTGETASPGRIYECLRSSAVLPDGLDSDDVGRGIPQAPQN